MPMTSKGRRVRKGLELMIRHRSTLVAAGGFLLAIAAGIAAGALYDLRVSRLPYDTSGGMYAGGQLITSLGTFVLVALATALLWAWLERRNERLWRWLGTLSVAFAGVGLVAALMSAGMGIPHHPALVLMSLLGLAQLLGVPLWTLTFLALTAIAPTPATRRRFLGATGLELVIAVVAAVHWFGR